MKTISLRAPRPVALALSALAAGLLLTACAPLLIGGAAVGGALVATDRRTTGTQVDDEAIELKGGSRAREAAGGDAHINITSYNRIVLLTGEVPGERERVAAQQALVGVEQVRSVVNELAVMGNSSLTARSNDTLLTSKVKTALIDAKDVQAQAIKVVTERATVYLMGRVTEREATRATAVASGISGVQKVVRVFEIVSEAELANIAPPRAASQPQ